MGDMAVQGRTAQREPIEHVPSLPPLVGDYVERRRTFSWDGARDWLQGDAEGHLNMAHEAVDRHARGELAHAVAVRFLARTAPTAELTYAQLREQSDITAAALRRPGQQLAGQACRACRARRSRRSRRGVPGVSGATPGPGAAAARAPRAGGCRPR
ncbi:hypothetical protein GCM10009721_30500 [Terrabacter tumescens]|uniref:Uncharacterized protein n=1 Tax=Terrabacter tumescens TaxID=60443 RepID=A0ABQ2I9B1_9MICO|nr:hypothetical protein [Terrabacter tumescens]GGN01199.1 hypothetical protein GCM10009721_30500 [Terrabacter tumescens]